MLLVEVFVVSDVSRDVFEVTVGRECRLVLEELGLVCDVVLDLGHLVEDFLSAVLRHAAEVGVLVILEPPEAAREADAQAGDRGAHADHQVVLGREPVVINDACLEGLHILERGNEDRAGLSRRWRRRRRVWRRRRRLRRRCRRWVLYVEKGLGHLYPAVGHRGLQPTPRGRLFLVAGLVHRHPQLDRHGERASCVSCNGAAVRRSAGLVAPQACNHGRGARQAGVNVDDLVAGIDPPAVGRGAQVYRGAHISGDGQPLHPQAVHERVEICPRGHRRGGSTGVGPCRRCSRR